MPAAWSSGLKPHFNGKGRNQNRNQNGNQNGRGLKTFTSAILSSLWKKHSTTFSSAWFFFLQLSSFIFKPYLNKLKNQNKNIKIIFGGRAGQSLDNCPKQNAPPTFLVRENDYRNRYDKIKF